MKIVITVFRLALMGVALLIIGVGVGYWGYALIQRDAVNVSQPQSEQQSPVSDSGVFDTTDESEASKLSFFDESDTFKKSDIEWIEHQERASLGLLIAPRYESITYSTIGKVKKSGTFEGDELVLVLADYGMDSEHYYVIVHNGSNYIIEVHSSDMVTAQVYETTIDTSHTFIAKNIILEELIFPDTIYGPKSRQTLNRYNPFWTGMSWFDSKDKTVAFIHPDYGTVYENAGHGFSFKSPDGTEIAYKLAIDFVSEEDAVPQVIWNDGTRNRGEYSSTDIGGCGSSNVASVMTAKDIDSKNDLVVAGKNTQGDVMWEFKKADHPLLKKIYDEEYFVIDYDGTGAQKLSYDEFVKKHPVFFWKDSFGRIIKFQSRAFLPVAECAKPVIYLYPQQEQRVTVDLKPEGGFTYSEPAYNGGWDVIAFPDGRLVDTHSRKEYPYLFWEGRGGYYEIPEQGFVVERVGVERLLREKLSLIGLNNTEIDDFVEYWVPEMQAKPYYFVTFMGNQAMDALAPLTVDPQPDTVIRVLMDFIPLDQPIDVEPLVLRTITRKGFTVVEWGGVRH